MPSGRAPLARQGKFESAKSMRAYSTDIRGKIVHAYETGTGSQRQIARRFDVSLSFVRDLLRQYRETGIVDPKKPGGSEPKIDSESRRLITRLVEDNEHLPLSRICQVLAEERQLRVSRTTVWRAIRKSNRFRVSSF
jgi:putative transposase